MQQLRSLQHAPQLATSSACHAGTPPRSTPFARSPHVTSGARHANCAIRSHQVRFSPSFMCVCVCYLQNSRLKKTLTNAGLYPTPGSRLKTQPSGSMAVFASGQPGAALVKGGGEPL